MDFKGKQVQKDLALREQDYLTVFKYQELTQERLSYAIKHSKISLPSAPPPSDTLVLTVDIHTL